MVKKLDAVTVYLNLSTVLMVFLSVYWWAFALIIMSMLASCLPGLQVVHGYVSFDFWWVKCQLKLLLTGVTLIAGMTIGLLLETRAKKYYNIAITAIYKMDN